MFGKTAARALLLEPDDLLVRLCAAVPTTPSEYPWSETSVRARPARAGDRDHADSPAQRA
jgi:hypothetical protein